MGKLINTILPQLTNDEQKQATIDALNKVLGEVNSPILALQHLDNKYKIKEILITAIDKKYPSITNKIEAFLKNIQSSDIGLEDNHPLKTYKSRKIYEIRREKII